MKIDLIFYFENAAVGIIYLKEWPIPFISLLRRYEKGINNEILKELANKCKWLIEDREKTNYFINNYGYENGNIAINNNDWMKFAEVYIQQSKGLTSKQILEHDNNYEELVKCSDTEFVDMFFYLLLEYPEKIPETQLFLIAKNLCDRGVSYAYAYTSMFYYVGIGVKKSKNKAKEYMKKAEALNVINDGIECFSLFDQKQKSI